MACNVNSENTEKKSGDVTLNDPIKELEDQLNAKEEESKETYDRLLRVSAEFENYKNAQPAKWKISESSPINRC